MTVLIYSIFLITTMLMKINTVPTQTTKVILEAIKKRLYEVHPKKRKR